MFREYCDLSGDDVTGETTYRISVIKSGWNVETTERAMQELTISPAEFLELKKYLDNRRKI